MNVSVRVVERESAPPLPSDGEMADTLRAAAALAGPTGTRTAVVRMATRALGSETWQEPLLKHLQHLEALGDLAGPPRGPAVSPAPLRALVMVEPGAAVLRYLLVGGPASVDLPFEVERPYLRLARLMAGQQQGFEEAVQALGGVVRPWTAWMGTRRARLDGEFLQARGAGLQRAAGAPESADLRLCRPGQGEPPNPTRWTRPRKADEGWFLARSGQASWWVGVEAGRVVRAAHLPWWEAAPLQFAVEREAGAPRTLQVEPDGDQAVLRTPPGLPREEWRLLRALSSSAGSGQWRMTLQDALWAAEVLEERLGLLRQG